VGRRPNRDHLSRGDQTMDEQKPQEKQEKESERRHPEDQIEDLAPDSEEADAVKGGVSFSYQQVQQQYQQQQS
jgi:hypothetical protein